MSNNVYAAPLSNLDDRIEAGSDDRFYVVSTRKMLILYFLTLGFYRLYWNYKNWSLHNKATGEGVWPVPRAIFSVFFTHALFRNVESHDATGERGSWDAGKLSTAMVIALITSNILARLSWKGIGFPYVNIASLLIMLPIGFLLKKAQDEINARCGDPAGSTNASFSAGNIALCVVGGLYWLLAIAGLCSQP
ncbi:hypothetical protein [Pseudoduganella violaceinigra]|uniref:hypothetical protein n=1 Tax=Pseudoduganella violaceinigra TaxID=246602 RepID=UPI000400100E|nr:hypothetical protein [Pseudoduganella violaceinigra]